MQLLFPSTDKVMRDYRTLIVRHLVDDASVLPPDDMEVIFSLLNAEDVRRCAKLMADILSMVAETDRGAALRMVERTAALTADAEPPVHVRHINTIRRSVGLPDLT